MFSFNFVNKILFKQRGLFEENVFKRCWKLRETVVCVVVIKKIAIQFSYGSS